MRGSGVQDGATYSREALKKSVRAKKQLNRETEAAINALIQSSYAFKKDNSSHRHPTPENILIFDEAQRVWNQEKMTKKHNDPMMAVSEPHLLYSIMDRHQVYY